MRCEESELRMAELLAGEIAADDRAPLERHLLDCEDCRSGYELARAGARIEWPDRDVPPAAAQAVRESIQKTSRGVRGLRWATAAAAALGLAALVLVSGRSPGDGPRPGPGPDPAPTRRPVLAMMQDAAMGALVCTDEAGRPAGELGLRSHEVSVEILDGIAKTTVEENFENLTDRRLEGTFRFPLPSDASISRLALEVNGRMEEGSCVERGRAREVFESIVRRMKDPALLEWQPGGLFTCRIFPIEARSTKRLILAYTQALPCYRGTMTYVYPLASSKTQNHPPGELAISVRAKFSGGLARISCPSHHLEAARRDAGEATLGFRAARYRPTSDFVVTMEPGGEDLQVVSHRPSDVEDGYFACFVSPRAAGPRTPARYAFVLDVSASISAPRLEVAKRLVRAMMERRIPGDRFEIIAHNVEIERSGEVDLRAANDFMDRLRPIGACDVLTALAAAGDAEIIYIGRGVPTFGETDPARILAAVRGRPIRAIGIGSDANVTLLSQLGPLMTLSQNDEVDRRVLQIAETLGAPAITGLKVDGGDAIYDVVGLRDVFAGDRLVVAGRYRRERATLSIRARGYERDVEVQFPRREGANNYLRRLWAQKKVAELLAQGPSAQREVTELGIKYQIMTPYTSFLVLENEQMWKEHELMRAAAEPDRVLSVRPPPARDSAGPGWSGSVPTDEPVIFFPDEKIPERDPLRKSFIPSDGTHRPMEESSHEGARMHVHFSLDHDAHDHPLGVEEIGPHRPVPIDGGREEEVREAYLDALKDFYSSGAAESADEENRLPAESRRVEFFESEALAPYAGKPRPPAPAVVPPAVARPAEPGPTVSKIEPALPSLQASGVIQYGSNVNVAPRRSVEGKVTAVAPLQGLVVISIGRDDGVLEGDEFTVIRGGEFVARLVVDRSDRKWSAGKVVLKRADPRVADDVSNHRAIGALDSPSTLRVVTASADGAAIRLEAQEGRPLVSQVFALQRAGRFVAVIRVTRVSDREVEAEVLDDLAVDRILPGDRSVRIPDLRGYLADLPAATRRELASRQNLRSIRAKMEMQK